MILTIADPPYPPRLSVRYDRAAPRTVTYSRASRYYGISPRAGDYPADTHPEAAEWDPPERHRLLLEELRDTADGWALATSADGLNVYAPWPSDVRVMSWHRLNSPPSGARLTTSWEPVLVRIPPERRARRTGRQLRDTLTAGSPRRGFTGAKPEAWTHWVLEALGYSPEVDQVVDMFPGSGAVAEAVATYPYRLRTLT